MQLLYSIGLKIYYLIVVFASLFNKKAKLWIHGRKNLKEKIAKSGAKDSKNIWIHVSSLGEFEQGLPVIELFKKKYPDYKIVLTFFSPSGFEAIKNKKITDYIFYLPLDSKKNAKYFIKTINPRIAFFVKYEYWHFFLKELYENKIPTYIFSAIFRKNHIFFKWYGTWYRKMLRFFTTIFVQNNESVELLKSISINNVIISGDTRFDRVIEISKQSRSFPEIMKFKNNKLTFIAGSSWQPDEEIIVNYINNCEKDIKFIIAPHNIGSNNIERVYNTINKTKIKYSQIGSEKLHKFQVLIIDNIGILSSIYKYGEIAYIGGGFGSGIHNTLEAAVFGMPVIFGTKYQNFQEAKDLISIKAGFSIQNQVEFNVLINKFIENKEFLQETSSLAKEYVFMQKGATERIFKNLSLS